jgi:hypothetical protein
LSDDIRSDLPSLLEKASVRAPQEIDEISIDNAKAILEAIEHAAGAIQGVDGHLDQHPWYGAYGASPDVFYLEELLDLLRKVVESVRSITSLLSEAESAIGVQLGTDLAKLSAFVDKAQHLPSWTGGIQTDLLLPVSTHVRCIRDFVTDLDQHRSLAAAVRQYLPEVEVPDPNLVKMALDAVSRLIARSASTLTIDSLASAAEAAHKDARESAQILAPLDTVKTLLSLSEDVSVAQARVLVDVVRLVQATDPAALALRSDNLAIEGVHELLVSAQKRSRSIKRLNGQSRRASDSMRAIPPRSFLTIQASWRAPVYSRP